MKNFLTLMLVILTSLSCTSVIGQASNSKQVTAIHEFELKDDTDPEEFETFVLTKIAPIYNQMKGQQFALAKGDRGKRLNKYAIILTFDSIDDRNRIYPEKGESTADWGGDDEVWEKLTSMTNGLWMHHTDYVRISQ